LPPLLRLFTFSYLTGEELYYKIALTCKSIRESLPNSYLLDQKKVIWFKLHDYPVRYPKMIHQRKDQIVKCARYALALADVIEFHLNALYLKQIRVVLDIIKLASPDPLQTPLIHPHIEHRHPHYYDCNIDWDYTYSYHNESTSDSLSELKELKSSLGGF
jgi:hypothetical protein